MIKKLFILLFILGSLLIFSILPLFNYSVDRWRLLHNDYTKYYKGFEPNKTYLKVKYLLNNLDNYDTLMMGSSRMGYIDGKLVSNKAYNMTSSFGLVATHLHNLKILIKDNTPIKNVWIGINDYVVWKDPIDFKSDFLRKPYGSNFIENINVYKYYLFKKPSSKDVDILRGKYKLINSEQIIDPNNMEVRRNREANIYKQKNYKQIFQKKKAVFLGYKDDKYRIKKVIQEIQEIKNLCKKHNIKLTLFMYPTSYIKYEEYNQLKIQEFKRELSKISNFHDFYRLDKIALNELYWLDTNHFAPSIGDYIIDHIKKNTYLITKDNIDDNLREISILENAYYDKLYEKRIFKYRKTKNETRIFDINNIKYKYHNNRRLTIIDKKLNTIHNDPIIILNNLTTQSKYVRLNYNIDSLVNTSFQLFYKETKNAKYKGPNSYKVSIKKGNNKISLSIPAKYINNQLRIDLVSRIGTYKINDFSIYEEK